jgi:transaldolase
MNNIHRLQELGQSVWLDNIDRGMLDSGELERMIAEDGIGGITSNPSIFEKAISKGNHYNAAMIGQLARDPSQSGRELFYELAIEDIQAAADLFRPVYESSHGRDGMASLEVSPELAYDTEGTVREARELWQRVHRPNLMIKVPATREGVAAIETLIADGINVNATLLFAVERYIDVAEAFMRGLEARMGRGQRIERVESVASFFVSRVDAAVEKRLHDASETQRQTFVGKVAIANARLAYQQWQRLFNSDRFARLRANGGRSQRLLWASTGTKNPDFSDVLYIDELIGPETVNTVPPATLQAFIEHGNVAPTLLSEGGVEQATALIADLEAAGVDMTVMTDELEQQGVELFAQAFANLIGVVQDKADNILASHKANG